MNKIHDKQIENINKQETGFTVNTNVVAEISLDKKEFLLPMGVCAGTVDSTNKYKKIMVSNIRTQIGIRGGILYKYKYIVLTLPNGEYKPQLLNSDGKLKSLEEIAQLNESENGWVTDIRVRSMIEKGKIRETKIAKEAKDAKEKEDTEKNSDIFLTLSDKPADKPKNNKQSIKQKFLVGNTYGEYCILEHKPTNSIAKLKDGTRKKTVGINGNEYRVTKNGIEINIWLTQTELGSRIIKCEKEQAAEKVQAQAELRTNQMVFPYMQREYDVVKVDFVKSL
jgi:hypothetical protein